MRTSRASSVTKKWLLFSQLCLLKDLVIRCVRQFIRRAKAMLLSQNVVVEAAEISVVVDVKSSQQDLNSFQIAQVRIRDSVCIEIPVPEETPLLGSVKTCSVAEEDVTEFVPKISSGSYADKGSREYMEDEHICIDDLSSHLASSFFRFPVPVAFYGVFDGHGGSEASQYIKENATRLFFEDDVFRESHFVLNNFFLQEVERSHREAYRKGKAVDMSFDHKSTFEAERRRVEELGGYFEEEYIYGELAVTRALGDWSLKRYSSLGGSLSPLISDPEIKQMVLTEEDEFLIMGCDGVWDVMTSQYAVTFARQGLRRHGDPRRCAMELGREAFRLDSADNVTVLVICFTSSSTTPQRRKIQFCVSDEARAKLQTMLQG